MSWKSLRLIFIAAVAVSVLACRGEKAPTAVPTEVGAELAPTLEVISPTVEFREMESGELETLDPGTEIKVEAGANVVVGETGHAELRWPSFLTNVLLSEADSLVSLTLPAERKVLLDQASGTARYLVQGPGEPADVQVKAAWTDIAVNEGVADFFVSLAAGAEPAVWVVVAEGKAQVTRGDAMITLHQGEAAGFTEDGPMPYPLEADLDRVMDWYDEATSGKAESDLMSVVFRCVVRADDLSLLAEPDEDAEAVSDVLAEKTVVDVKGRDNLGDWLYVSVVETEETGWLPADELDCIGPIMLIKVSEGVVEKVREAIEATVTSAPRPTVIYVTSTPAPVLTPQATFTPPTGEVTIKFWADSTTIKEGECTQIHWETSNISEVYYQGNGVAGTGTAEECPTRDTTYELKVHLRDGTWKTSTVTIKVKHDDEDKPTSGPPPEASVPPEPTRAATNTPYVPPTEAPEPTAEPPTEAPPQPTEAPPEPTDEPPQPTAEP